MEDMLLENTATEAEASEAQPLSEEEAEAAAEEVTEEAPEESPETEALTEADFERIAAEDLEALRAQFPALRDISSLAALPDPSRYGELRELGLSPAEAYLATGGKPRRGSDNRAHLTSAVPRMGAIGTAALSTEQMAEARRLFSDLSDAQIHRLYKRVTNERKDF